MKRAKLHPVGQLEVSPVDFLSPDLDRRRVARYKFANSEARHNVNGVDIPVLYGPGAPDQHLLFLFCRKCGQPNGQVHLLSHDGHDRLIAHLGHMAQTPDGLRFVDVPHVLESEAGELYAECEVHGRLPVGVDILRREATAAVAPVQSKLVPRKLRLPIESVTRRR